MFAKLDIGNAYINYKNKLKFYEINILIYLLVETKYSSGNNLNFVISKDRFNYLAIHICSLHNMYPLYDCF